MQTAPTSGNNPATRSFKGKGLMSGMKLTNTAIEISSASSGPAIQCVRPKYTLNELLAGITPPNLHSEVSTGTAVGKEVYW